LLPHVRVIARRANQRAISDCACRRSTAARQKPQAAIGPRERRRPRARGIGRCAASGAPAVTPLALSGDRSARRSGSRTPPRNDRKRGCRLGSCQLIEQLFRLVQLPVELFFIYGTESEFHEVGLARHHLFLHTCSLLFHTATGDDRFRTRRSARGEVQVCSCTRCEDLPAFAASTLNR
jgi:hypothetical protein